MAWTTGTAVAGGGKSALRNVYDALISFLTTNPELVAAERNWEIIRAAEEPKVGSAPEGNIYVTYLIAPGTSGQDRIHINIGYGQNQSAGIYGIILQGATDHSPTETLDFQPGKSPYGVLNAWNNEITYWFFANGSRVIAVVKSSTTYAAIHAGFLLPAGTPAEYPYPLYIGAPDNTWRLWSQIGADQRSPFDPGELGCYLRQPNGSWSKVTNRDYFYRNVKIFPQCMYNMDSSTFRFFNFAPTKTGEYVLRQSFLWAAWWTGSTPEQGDEILNGIMGDIQGVYYSPGFGTGTEAEITVNGEKYFIFQNMNRTGEGDYTAIKQE
ncbi:hypothetical protein RSP_0013 [Pseudomonas phage RSP]|nr:hypothetical protein RSP_0013 [Pseudomonas phage RSP]